MTELSPQPKPPKKSRKGLRGLPARAIFLVVVAVIAWRSSILVLPQPVNKEPAFASPRELKNRATDSIDHSQVEERIRNAWKRVHSVFDKHGPKSLEGLNPPATEEQLTELENELGYPLPYDLRCSLLIHNGCDTDKPTCFEYRLLSANDISAVYDAQASYSVQRHGGWGHSIPSWQNWKEWQPDIIPIAVIEDLHFILWIEVSTGKVFTMYEGISSTQSDSFLEWLEKQAKLADDGNFFGEEDGFPFVSG